MRRVNLVSGVIHSREVARAVLRAVYIVINTLVSL